MTRFDELVRLSGEQLRQELEYIGECKSFAYKICKTIRAVFEVPAECFSFTKLDRDLELADGESPRGLELVAGPDNFHFFAVSFELRDGNVFQILALTLGVRKSEKTYTILTDRPFDIHSDEDLNGFVDMLYKDLKDDFSAPIGQPRRKFGFITEKTNS